MIGYLSGVVRHREPARAQVVIDVGGVGYEVSVSLQGLAAIPAEGEPVTLWIHTHVREDALELFGFPTREERSVFQALLAVPQVGPRLALTVLGGMPLPDLLETVAGRDPGRLRSIPGVGKKTAERILLDLPERLPKPAGNGPSPGAVAGPRAEAEEAVAALVHAGFRRRQAEDAVAKAAEKLEGAEASAEALVQAALTILVGR